MKRRFFVRSERYVELFIIIHVFAYVMTTHGHASEVTKDSRGSKRW